MEHRVFIEALHTDCRIDAAPEAGEMIRRSFDYGLRQLLPSRLAAPLNRVLDGHDGVIRLRRLDVSLALDSQLDPASMAEAMAHRISDALRRALSGTSGDIAVWPSQNHYIAAYVEYRLSLAPAPFWAFGDFSALQHLSPSQAAAAILGDRPQALAVLAQRKHTGANPARFVTALDGECALSLCATILRAAKTAPVAADHPAILKSITDAIAANPTSYTAPPLGQSTLRLALHVLAHSATEILATQAVSVAAQVMAVLFLLRQDINSAKPARLRDLLAQPQIHARRLPKDWQKPFQQAYSHPPTITAIAQLDTILRRGTNTARPTTPVKGTKPTKTRPPRDLSQPFWTPYAGLALLSSTIQRLGIARHLDARQLYATALALLPVDQRKTAALDPGVNALFPFDPKGAKSAAWPDLPPQPLASDPANTSASSSAPLLQPGQNVAAWANLILASFAQRLPGLAASSTPYLQRQFLLQSGQITQTDETFTVDFAPIPLGVVLSMSGLLGFQGRIQHLQDRELILSMKRTP